MKIYRCDICGELIEPSDKSAVYRDRETKYGVSGILGLLQNNLDVCGHCREIGKGIDFEEAMVEHWKKKVFATSKTFKCMDDETAKTESICHSFNVDFGVARCYGTKKWNRVLAAVTSCVATFIPKRGKIANDRKRKTPPRVAEQTWYVRLAD